MVALQKTHRVSLLFPRQQDHGKLATGSWTHTMICNHWERTNPGFASRGSWGTGPRPEALVLLFHIHFNHISSMIHHHGIWCLLSHSLLMSQSQLSFCEIFSPEIPGGRHWAESHGSCCPASPHSHRITTGALLVLWTVLSSGDEDTHFASVALPQIIQMTFCQAESLLKEFKILKREKLKCLTWKSSEESTKIGLLWVMSYSGAPGVSSLTKKCSWEFLQRILWIFSGSAEHPKEWDSQGNLSPLV